MKLQNDGTSRIKKVRMMVCFQSKSYKTFSNLFLLFDQIEIPRLISNVHTMFEASTKLQTVSSEAAAEKGLPDWILFQTAADEVFGFVSLIEKLHIHLSFTWKTNFVGLEFIM